MKILDPDKSTLYEHYKPVTQPFKNKLFTDSIVLTFHILFLIFQCLFLGTSFLVTLFFSLLPSMYFSYSLPAHFSPTIKLTFNPAKRAFSLVSVISENEDQPYQKILLSNLSFLLQKKNKSN